MLVERRHSAHRTQGYDHHRKKRSGLNSLALGRTECLSRMCVNGAEESAINFVWLRVPTSERN
jgi:hypothetical protein